MNDLSQNAFYGPIVQPLGQHLIAELYGATRLYDHKPVELILERASKAAGAHVLRIDAHDFGARDGFTAMAILAESHISLHTWPEHGYLALDIFMCGDARPERALRVLEAYFQPSSVESHIIRRGLPVHVSAYSPALAV